MSQQLISRSPDLQRLIDDGYEVEIAGGHLIIHSVPYVNAKGVIRLGTLVSVLDSLNGDTTGPPKTHVALFAGEHPCDNDGNKVPHLDHSPNNQQIRPGLVMDRSFSCKPKPSGRYDDYHHKMTTYVSMISRHAQKVDPNVTAQTRQVIEASDPDSPFNYIDNASARAGIEAHTAKLALGKVAIIGLGGTGSYVLDQAAKTPVAQIHLYDGDWFDQHTAFRSPGAASIEELRAHLRKVDYYHELYSRMHRGIVPHAVYVDETNIGELKDFDFVFLCMDARPGKEIVVRKLEEFGIPFIDTGMGLEDSDAGIRGIVRVTTSTPEKRGHVWEKNRIPMGGGDADAVYATNIQVADLNALNAMMAVIRWKKLFGFYADLECEHFAAYTIDGNATANDDQG